MPALEDVSIFDFLRDDEDEVQSNYNCSSSELIGCTLFLSEYQQRFHSIKDAKLCGLLSKSRFGGNVKSKRVQKEYPEANNFENFMYLDIEGQIKQMIVCEADIKGSSGSSSNSQNVAFLSAEDTSSSNEVLIKLRLNALTVIEGAILQGNVEHQEIKGTGMKMQAGTTPKGLYQGTSCCICCLGQCFGLSNIGDDMTWSYIAQVNQLSFALMPTLQTPSIVYTKSLESVEAQLIIQQKNEVVYEEKITVLEFEVKDKSNAITRLKNRLDETLREKDDLKAKL
ncbi:hypothetical protein Tco_0282566 [Tanacetum coccineum]